MRADGLKRQRGSGISTPLLPVALAFAGHNCARLEALDGNSEHISDAALGLDDARRAGIALELAPEAEDLHVDAAIEDIFVNAGRLQKVFPAQRTLRGFEEGEQHRVLAFGQRDRDSGRVSQLASTAIKLPAGKSKSSALGIAN